MMIMNLPNAQDSSKKISCLYTYSSSFYLVAVLTLATFLAPCRANEHMNLPPGEYGLEERCGFYGGGTAMCVQ